MNARQELLATAKSLGLVGYARLKSEEIEKMVKSATTAANRKGNKSGNVPWRRKNYFLDVDAYTAASEQVSKAPNQVQLILKSMVNHDLTSPLSHASGAQIAKYAIEDGMATKIEPAVLFAYYRRVFETLGVVHVK